MVLNGVLLTGGPGGVYQLIHLTTYKDDEIREKDEVLDGTAAWAVHVAGGLVCYLISLMIARSYRIVC